MAIIPLVFLIQPLVSVFALPSSASRQLAHRHELLYMLGIPALVPAFMAAYSVVGERQQGTLEPVLTTPISREELLLAKALAVLALSVAVSYAVYAGFLACVELFGWPGVAPAIVRAPDIIAQLIFTPLITVYIDLDRDRDLNPLERHPRRAAAQRPREPPLDRRDDADRGQRDPRDAHARTRTRRGAAARRSTRLARQLSDVRPRETDHRQYQ
jgi:hypothetical protein